MNSASVPFEKRPPRQSSSCDASTSPSASQPSTSFSSGISTISSSSPSSSSPSSSTVTATVHRNGPFPPSYTRHSNLDVRPLSLVDRLRLVRIHYLTIPNTIRTGIVIFCLTWFIYVATFTLKDYVLHDTVVFLNYETPRRTKPPGITLCTHNILSQYDSKTLANISAWSILTEDDVLHQNHYMPHVSISCYFVPDTTIDNFSDHVYNCSDLVPVVISMQEGHRCFTYMSDIYGQTTRNLKKYPHFWLNYDRSPIIHFEIEGDYVYGIAIPNPASNNPYAPVTFSGIYIAIHNARILPDQTGQSFHQLSPEKLTAIQFTKRIISGLGEPYNACRKYSSKSLNYSTVHITSEQQFRTRGECFLHCQWNMLNRHSCANYYSIYTTEMVEMQHASSYAQGLLEVVKRGESLLNSSVSFDPNSLYKICPWNNNSYFNYLHTRQICMERCPVSCKEVTYEDLRTVDYKNTIQKPVVAQITWAPKTITTIFHRPKWEMTDLLGTIGGQAHIWVGISIVSLLNLLIHIIKTIRSSDLLPKSDCCMLTYWWTYVRRDK